MTEKTEGDNEQQLFRVRQAALEEAAQIAEQYKRHYSVFTPDGQAISGQAARCIRIAADKIAAEIRKVAEETGVETHASQQPHSAIIESIIAPTEYLCSNGRAAQHHTQATNAPTAEPASTKSDGGIRG